MRKSLLIQGVVLWCALFTTSTFAADTNGSFSVRNLGAHDCSVFINNFEQHSADYQGWIDGYISAFNQLSYETFDLMPWANTPFLTNLVRSHCAKNPSEKFFAAVNKLIGATAKSLRLDKQAKLVKVERDGQSTYIYDALLAKINEQLLGETPLASDGDLFSEELQNALIAYQKQHALSTTGLPDQVTIYYLLVLNKQS